MSFLSSTVAKFAAESSTPLSIESTEASSETLSSTTRSSATRQSSSAAVSTSSLHVSSSTLSSSSPSSISLSPPISSHSLVVSTPSKVTSTPSSSNSAGAVHSSSSSSSSRIIAPVVIIGILLILGLGFLVWRKRRKFSRRHISQDLEDPERTRFNLEYPLEHSTDTNGRHRRMISDIRISMSEFTLPRPPMASLPTKSTKSFASKISAPFDFRRVNTGLSAQEKEEFEQGRIPGENMRIATRMENGSWQFSEPVPGKLDSIPSQPPVINVSHPDPFSNVSSPPLSTSVENSRYSTTTPSLDLGAVDSTFLARMPAGIRDIDEDILKSLPAKERVRRKGKMGDSIGSISALLETNGSRGSESSSRRNRPEVRILPEIPGSSGTSSSPNDSYPQPTISIDSSQLLKPLPSPKPSTIYPYSPTSTVFTRLTRGSIMSEEEGKWLENDLGSEIDGYGFSNYYKKGRDGG